MSDGCFYGFMAVEMFLIQKTNSGWVVSLTWLPHQVSPSVSVNNMSLVHLRWSSCCIRAEDWPGLMSMVMPPEIWAWKYCVFWIDRMDREFEISQTVGNLTTCSAATSPLGVVTASPSSVHWGGSGGHGAVGVGAEAPPTAATGDSVFLAQLYPACPHGHTCPDIGDMLGTLLWLRYGILQHHEGPTLA